jgi:cellulose synthase/poly-beta-1,6-N-acetylglucosamine synthase-like glycosyltransferase
VNPDSIWFILAAIPVVIQTVLLLIPFRDLATSNSARPKVSILLAVRNEEVNIEKCLESLLKQNYPEDQIEIIVGDDGSKDETAAIVSRYAGRHQRVVLKTIDEQTSSSVGKANVLSQIANEATGKYLLITDADTRPEVNWISDVVKQMEGEEADMLVGVTAVQGKRLFHKIQNYEWIMILSMMKTLADLGFPVTGLGNNMAIRREAYFKSGGYENLPHSITEDFALVRRFKDHKMKVVNSFSQNSLAQTDPLEDWRSLLNQRKRWMRGAFRLGPAFVFVLLSYSIYIVPLVMTFQVNPVIGWALLSSKIALTQGMLFKAQGAIARPFTIYTGLLFEVFWELFWPVSLVYYVLPSKIEWKGRLYR